MKIKSRLSNEAGFFSCVSLRALHHPPGVVNLTGGMLFKDTFIKDKISHIRFSSGG